MANFRTKAILLSMQFFSLLVLPFVTHAQSSGEMKRIFSQAESYYLYGEYELANQLFILLDNPENYNIKYKIGVCYLNIPGEKEKAVPFLEEAVKNSSYEAKEELYKERRAPLDAWFYLARAYMVNNELEKGLATFQQFRKLAAETDNKGGMENIDFVDQQIQACNNAISFRESPVMFSKRSLGPGFSEGSINENPAVSHDGNTMVFTERRGILNVIWFSKKIRGVWETPVEITGELKAGDDCSTCSLNSDGTELYLYKTDDFDGAIYVSKYINDIWKPVQKLNRNINTRFYESHASVSADGKRLFFTSNREGSLGGLDIYVSEKEGTGDWGPAKNLGPVVNTPFNEDTPFITSNDSILYFSSEGHSSMGGFDNYMSVRTDSSWLTPTNIGYPVNTTDDDRFFQPANDGLNAFYSITTDYKQKDIFYLGFGGITFELKGTVKLTDTTLIFDENYMVTLKDKKTGDTLERKMPEPYSGKYLFRVKPGDYDMTFSGTGYFTQKIDTLISPDYPLAEVFIDVSLTRDPSQNRPVPKIVYEKIDLSEIPTIASVDTSILIRDLDVTDVTDNSAEEEVLYFTVQVMALHNPVDVSFFKYIDNIKILYNETDKFYRYTTGEFPTREDAYKWRLDLISRGYPEEIFIKKVTKSKEP